MLSRSTRRASAISRWPLKVFVSHSSLDKRLARCVAEQYRSRGIEVWIDEGELGPGDTLAPQLTKAISNAHIFVLILTTHSVQSEWVRYELRNAVLRLQAAELSIVPMLFDDVEVPEELDGMVWADCRSEAGLTKCITMSLRRAGAEYPLSADSIRARYDKRTPLGYGLRMVPVGSRHNLIFLGPEARKYVVVGDYAEQCGRSLRQILGNLKSGDSFDRTTVTGDEWTAIIFEVGEHNYKKLDVLPGTWKAVFRILSDKKRLGWADMSDEEAMHLGSRPRDYYAGDQNYWYNSVIRRGYSATREAKAYSPDFLSTRFGIDDLCFDGSGITHSSSPDSLMVPSRLFLVKNMPLNAVNHRTQILGRTKDGILLD